MLALAGHETQNSTYKPQENVVVAMEGFGRGRGQEIYVARLQSAETLQLALRSDKVTCP